MLVVRAGAREALGSHRLFAFFFRRCLPRGLLIRKRSKHDKGQKCAIFSSGFLNFLQRILSLFLQVFYGLSGPISRDTAILSLRYPISRDTFLGRLALPQNGAIPPSWYLVLHRHICAIPRFATYRAILVRYPIKTSTKVFCDTIAASIARYEKYR